MNIYRKKIYTVFFTLIIINTMYSQHFWYAKTGLNYSTLENLKDIKPGFGYNIAVGREWNVYKTFYISLGLEYSVRSFTLKNRAIGPISYMGEYHMGRSVYNYDIKGSTVFIEIPFQLKYRFVINKLWKISVHLGGSKSYPIKDLTKLKRKEYLFEYEKHLRSKIFKFLHLEDTSTDYDRGYILTFGLGFLYQNYGLDIEYQKDTRDVIYLDHLLDIKAEVHNLRISLAVFI